jgi:hypothetical protein
VEPQKFKVAKIAIMWNVSPFAVYEWIKNGLPTETIKEFGKKPYKVIDPEDVKKYRGEI